MRSTVWGAMGQIQSTNGRPPAGQIQSVGLQAVFCPPMLQISASWPHTQFQLLSPENKESLEYKPPPLTNMCMHAHTLLGEQTNRQKSKSLPTHSISSCLIPHRGLCAPGSPIIRCFHRDNRHGTLWVLFHGISLLHDLAWVLHPWDSAV